MFTLSLSPNIDNTFTVVEDINILGHEIPHGFKTNGADIPRFLWWYIAPNTPKYLPAIVVHDYYCSLEMYEEGDEAFKDILSKIENSFKAKVMVKSVKLYTKWVRK